MVYVGSGWVNYVLQCDPMYSDVAFKHGDYHIELN